MKILWVSPNGEGLQLGERCRAAGHAVVTYGHAVNLPLVQQKDLWTFAKAADLVVVDGPFPLERTRRSWKPSRDSLFFDELRRKHDITALGPTPTVDLLVGDPRYLKKNCGRFGTPYGAADGEGWTSSAWFRANDIVPPGPLLNQWRPLFKAVGFRGWFELRGAMTADGPTVWEVSATWRPDAIPDGREAEFLLEMAR